MYMDLTMAKQMLRNVEVLLKEGNLNDFSMLLLSKYNNKFYFTPVLETIKAYNDSTIHKDIFRIALINYKKFTFLIGLSYYSEGRALVLIKLPIDKEPVALSITTHIEPELFEICYNICDEVSSKYYKEYDNEEYEFDMEDTMSKFSKWNEFRPINKGLHNNKKPIQREVIVSDDDAMNILDDYIKKCEEFYEITDNRFDILINNVKTFDVGTVHTLDQLTNLVRFMYNEYYFNDNLKVYDSCFNEDSFLPECSLKFFLRHLDITLENILNGYLVANGDEFVVDEFIDLFEPIMLDLQGGYGVMNALRMYYDSGELGVFDVVNDVLLYQKNVGDLAVSITLNDDNKYKKSFYLYDQEMKKFFMELIEKTNFIDLFLGIVFTDPTLLKGFLENENNDGDNFF